MNSIQNIYKQVKTDSDFIHNGIHHLALIGAGIAIFPLLVFLVFILWHGGWAAMVSPVAAIAIVQKQLDALAIIAFGLLAIYALIVISLAGVIKSLKASLPGGASIELGLQDDSKSQDQLNDNSEH